MMPKTRALAMCGMVALLFASGAKIAAEPSATPRLDWLFNGRVSATARIGNTLYVGGDFTRVMPSSGALGNLLALSPTTGALVPTNIQTLDIVPYAMEPDGAGGYFIAGFGNFGTTRKIVHTRPDGSVDPAFQPPLGTFGRMLRVGTTLFVGGYMEVNGVSLTIVALDTATGALLPFAPALPAGYRNVSGLATDGNRLFLLLGGGFENMRYVAAVDVASGAPLWQSDVTGAPVGGSSSALRMVGGRLIAGIGRLYSLDPSTGVVDPAWAAGQVANGSIITIVASGQTIYVGGSFTTFHGQPRARLAAVDAATGALLPWSPQASEYYVTAMAVSPTGTVFVGASSDSFTINGLARGVFEIDASGAVTPFAPAASIDAVGLLHFTPAGSLLISASGAYIGRTSRARLAAFDLTSGALLPEAPTLSGQFASSIDELASAGQTLYLKGIFNTLNGQARAGVGAVDVSSGTVLPWPAPGVSVHTLGPIEGTAMYATVLTSPSEVHVRRLHTVTGAIDPSWTPTLGGQVFVDRGELLFITGLLDSTGFGTVGSRVGVLDAVTGQFREWLRTQPGSFINRLLPDGGTVYLHGTDPTNVYHPLDPGRTIYAIDRATGVPVWRPPVSGRINSAAVVDGRVILGGRNLTVGGIERYGAVETTRTGQLTGWSAGFAPYGPNPGAVGPPGGVSAVTVHGDVVAVTGFVGETLRRVAVFDLSGSAAPSGLRSRAAAGVVEFSWDPPATAPAGGYVIDGGFVPGQVAASIPVGTGTTFTTPVSVIGPAFIRVRAQGSAEVSNEIVAGCVAPPLPPTALTSTIAGTTLTLAWLPPLDAVTSYVFSAGTASSLSDAATTTLPASLTSISGTVPGGTFFVRVQAANACGTSGPSGEVFMTMGAPDPLAVAPTNLAATVSGSTVSLTWTAPAGPVTGYVLEGGTALGLANIGAIQVGAITSFAIPGAPPGVYAVRVRAITSAGSGAPSADVVVVVP